jgi:hypothetical protein
MLLSSGASVSSLTRYKKEADNAPKRVVSEVSVHPIDDLARSVGSFA